MAERGLAFKAAHDPRTAALAALVSVLRHGESSQAALEKVLQSPDLQPSDKGLTTELVYGVLRHYRRLDWFLRRFLPRPEGLPDEMLTTLLLAAYELAHLRTPDYAAVNWAVEHARHRFSPGLAKVANGTLRSFQRSQSDYQDRAFYADRSIYYSVPPWLCELWDQTYGPADSLSILEASSRPAPTGLRVNASRPDWKNLLHNLRQAEGAIAAGLYGVGLPSGHKIFLKELLDSGRASRQSAAAHEALCAMDPAVQDNPLWEGPIWDACAGRGGKTLSLLEMGLPVALVTDPSQERLAALPGEYRRLFTPDSVRASLEGVPPLPEILPVKAEDAPAGPAAGKFATILIDAPCSGLGTLARRPEIRLRRGVEDLKQLAALQDSILDAAKERLKKGGRIIYLTCTLNPGENECRVQSFLQRHPGFGAGKTWATPPGSPLGEFFWAAEILG